MWYREDNFVEWTLSKLFINYFVTARKKKSLNTENYIIRVQLFLR